MQVQEASSTPGNQSPERPTLAPGVEMLGELDGSAFQDSQWLIKRRGRFIQVAEPLYRVAQFSNGQRTVDEIAELLGQTLDAAVTGEDIGRILAQTLIPMGIVEDPDEDPEPEEPPSDRGVLAPLSVNVRLRVLGPGLIDPATRILQWLYAPVPLVPLLVSIAAVHWWLYAQHGFSTVLRDVMYTPGALVFVLGLYLAGAMVHEFGHASGLRYGGGRARAIGVGIYLIYPVFYTDTTDSYRLGRWGRVRTDLGGFYFHLLFALAIVAAYLMSGHEWLLLVILLIDLDIVRQLFPFVRFDGYWALTDLLGVPDILSHLRGTVTRGLKRGARPSGVPALKPWPRAVFAIYTLVTVPLLGAMVVFLLVRGPLIFSSVWNALVAAAGQLQAAWAGAQVWAGLLAGVQLALLSIQATGLLLMLFMVVRQPVQALWRWSGPRAAPRAATSVVSGAGICFLLYYWGSTLAPIYGGTITGVRTFDVTARNHVQGHVQYHQSPPVAGPHAPVFQNCGFYSRPITNEDGVHSMEHGAVWITYRPDLPPSQVAALRTLARKQSYVLVSPYPDLPSPVVASAWNRQLRLNSADDIRLDLFIRVFREGSQAPEHGGPCTGGAGTPE